LAAATPEVGGGGGGGGMGGVETNQMEEFTGSKSMKLIPLMVPWNDTGGVVIVFPPCCSKPPVPQQQHHPVVSRQAYR